MPSRPANSNVRQTDERASKRTTFEPVEDLGSRTLRRGLQVLDAVLAHGRDYADGVFDFAAAVADPARPTRLAPAFDSGDGLHLSPAGYRALAAAVDLPGLTGSPCLADTSPARVVVSAD